MKHPIVRLTPIAGLTLAAFLASAVVSFGQHAVPRDSGSSGGGSSSGSGSSGSTGSTASSNGSSGGGSTMSTPSGGDGGRAVPRHPTTASSGGGGGRGGGDGIASGRGRAGAGYNDGADRSPNGAPTTSRPQGNNPTVGYAIPRGTVVVPPGRPGGDYWYYPGPSNWYYNPWGWGTWGLGYVWDPFWFGPGTTLGYPGYGYGYGGGYGAGYGAGYGGGYAGDYRREDVGEGALRIKVKPREAKVIVDGSFAGTVDDFDGKFQKLRLDAGPHKVRLEAEGFLPVSFDVLIVDGETVNYTGKLPKN